eukprot:g25491.t1
MDVSALYTSIPRDDGIATIASVLNTTNCQFPDTVLKLICFILNHNILTFDNQFFIQMHGTDLPPISFLDTRKSIKDFCTSLYHKHTDNLAMLHFSNFKPKHIKTAIPYGQVLHMHRIFLDERVRDRRLKVLKDTLIETGGEHFSGQGHSASDLQVNVLQGGLWDAQQRRVAEQRLIAMFDAHEDGLNRDLGLMSHW